MCACLEVQRFWGTQHYFFPALFETLALVRRIWKQFLWDVLLAVCWKPISSFKHTKQIRFSFSFKGRCRTWRVTPLRSRCYRATFKANANGHHSDTPWTQSGSLPRTLRPRTQRKKKHSTDILRHTAEARAAESDGDTWARTFAQKMDLCVLLAFRQTNCLLVDNRASEVRMRRHPEIHLFKKKKWERQEWEDVGRGEIQNGIGESEEDILTE